ncbi:MAG TPA: ribosome maturation factor RimM [Acidimicrobiia bacterium]|nr:ribosome maturation factor RimM [Acidimicrobiia bacterium]
MTVPETERVTVGTVGKPHGLNGTVVIHPETDNPARFERGQQVRDDTGRLLTIDRCQSSQAVLLVSFAEVSDREGAETLRGATLSIDPLERRTLSADEFWPEDLIGLEARDPTGNVIGSIRAVDADSPQGRLTIATPRGDFIVPLVNALVPEVNLVGGYLVVQPIEGLLEP